MVKKIIVKNGEIPSIKECVACIGYFDGVHLGHQQLINKTINEANRLGLIPTLICFDPDPLDIIFGKKNKHLLSFKDRLNVISYFGIEQIIVIKFDSNFMNISPINFVNNYLNKMNIKELVCGYDYTFGYKAKGNVDLLQERFNSKLIVIDEYLYYGKKVSTTRIKDALFKGNFKLANKLIGWEYCLSLKVNKCIKKGSKWLIEAKTVDPNCLLPKDGIYGDYFEISNNSIYLFGKTKLEKNTNILISFDNYE